MLLIYAFIIVCSLFSLTCTYNKVNEELQIEVIMGQEQSDVSLIGNHMNGNLVLLSSSMTDYVISLLEKGAFCNLYIILCQAFEDAKCVLQKGIKSMPTKYIDYNTKMKHLLKYRMVSKILMPPHSVKQKNMDFGIRHQFKFRVNYFSGLCPRINF